MKILETKYKTLEDIFIMELQFLYDMESEIVKALPKVIESATDPDLKEGLLSHLEETKEQVDRLERAFIQIGKKPDKVKSEAVRGLIKDGEDIIKEEPPAAILDLGIIASCRNIERFEISEYLTAIAWAEALGYDAVIKLLAQSLDEESMAESKLADGNDALLAKAQEMAVGSDEE